MESTMYTELIGKLKKLGYRKRGEDLFGAP